MATDEQSVARKRSRKQSLAEDDELEINLSLPEPPSKKAKRLAKKLKSKGNGEDQTSHDVAAGESEKVSQSVQAAAKIDGETPKSQEGPRKRSEWAIWIGNLEFSVTKDNLRTFLSAKGQIDQSDITRVNLPAPPKQPGPRQDNKRLHKGFAYVDFANEESMNKAIALSEEDFAGRKVLIKNAKSFVGRPDASETIKSSKSKHPPNKRVWVGNLAYDVDPEDLRKHFSQAGEVEDVSLMTWEDSGRCKGFGFIRFTDLAAAETAVKGFVLKKAEENNDKTDDRSNDDEAEESVRKRRKPRKWFINRLFGRQLDVQFAEDSSTRYKKRYAQSDETET